VCYYAASSGNFLQTLRDNLSVPLSAFQQSKESMLSQYGVYKGKSVGDKKSQECGVSCHHRFSFGFLNPEDGTERLSRNVGKKLPLSAA
jgi:hypothetical protein